MNFFKPLSFLVILLNLNLLFSQEVPEKNYDTFDAFLSEQQSKIGSIKIGESKDDIKSIVGNNIKVRIPKVGRMKPLNKVFKQPEYIDHFNTSTDKPVSILWYFSNPKDQNGLISKRECTPIVLVNDKVIGKGWEFFNSFRKRHPLRK